MRKAKDYILLFLKGMGMGAADVVPGVSGGTIAFITGIYEELLESIRSVNKDWLLLLRRFKIVDAYQHINGNFLVVLLAGILLSALSVGPLVADWLEVYPIQTWSFFFGLIVISCLSVARQASPWRWKNGLAAVIGAGIAFYVTIATPAQTPEALWFVGLSGAIAICAMILPGISGAFILLLLGKYRFIFDSISNFDTPVILAFMIGVLVGLISFARGLSWLLKHHHNVTVGLLAGFMVGSLNKIWPWKEVVTFRVNSHGEQVPLITRNILPTDFQAITGQEPHILQAILFVGLGVFLVVVLEKIATMRKRP
ncbi:MAG: DUF368 domain-containing protein [Bacteroidota bacterium]